MGRTAPATLLPAAEPAHLSRTATAESQRRRLLRAMVESVAAHGYAAASVTEVVAMAGVSKRTFYEQFSDKESCFLACIDSGAERLLSALAIPPDPGVTAIERLDAVVATYLELLTGERAFAKAYLVETIAAGPTAVVRRLALLGRFTALLESLHQQAIDEGAAASGLSADYGLIAAGISSAVTMCVASGEARQLPELHDRLTRFVLSTMGICQPGAEETRPLVAGSNQREN